MYEMIDEGTVIKHVAMTDEDRAAWWWMAELGGWKWTFEAMERWGF